MQATPNAIGGHSRAARATTKPSAAALPTNQPAQPLPADLAAVALIDASAAAGAGSMSLSWWHAEVAAGRAPAPVLRRPRCTRWRLADVATFWRDFGSQPDGGAAEGTKARASKASAAARVKRCSAAATTQAGA